jgi:hypothetical protein
MVEQVKSKNLISESIGHFAEGNLQGNNMGDFNNIHFELTEQEKWFKENRFAFLFDDYKFFKKISKSNVLIETIRKEIGDEILYFLADHLTLNNQHQILYTSKQNKILDQVDYNNIQTIVNFQKVNVHPDINHWYKSINKLLPVSGLYAGCVETYDNRKQRRERVYGKALAKVIGCGDFIFHRILPRLKYTKKIYDFVTGSKYKALSLAEALGRLVYCGFAIVDYIEINRLIYFIAKKTGEPKNVSNISDGLIFPMSRVGKYGKIIKVYKLRTMHPYSEFLQDFIVKRNGYNHLGKPANDFRLANWGKIFRKLWLDEIPQIFNLLKGELGIVGVRPLSQTRFSQFPEDLREERIKYKPGCIPPYVALCMPDAIGNIIAERIYLREIKKSPYFTNLKYFLKAVYNILTNKIRSN